MDQEIMDELNSFLKNKNLSLFLLSLRNIAKKEGMASLSKKTGIGRERLYKILKKDATPKLDTFMTILKAFGLHLFAQEKKINS